MYECLYPTGYAEIDPRRVFGWTIRRRLRALRERDDVERVPAVALLALKARGRTLREALLTLAHLLRPEHWTWIHRNAVRVSDVVSFSGVTEYAANARTGGLPESWVLPALLSLSRDGFVRERAVERLADAGAERALPFLIMSATDHVPQVGGDATGTLRHLLTPEHAERWAAALGVVERESRRFRFPRDLLDDVYALLSRGDATLLRRNLRSEDRHLRRAAARVLLANDSLPDDAAGELAASRDNVVVRELVGSHHVTQHPGLLVALARSRDTKAATEALVRIAELDPGAARPLAEEALFSGRAAVRRVARHLLSGWGDDVDERVVAVLLDDEAPAVRRAAALAEFARIAGPADLGLYDAALRSSDSRVRRAAIRGIARLAPERVETLVSALADPSAAVARAAGGALCRRARVVPLDALTDLLAGQPEPHTVAAVLWLLQHRPPGEAGPSLLAAAALLHGSRPRLVERALRRWRTRLGRADAYATREQLRGVERALVREAPRLPGDAVADAERTVKHLLGQFA